MYSDEMKKKEYKFYTIGIGILLLLITIFFCIQSVNGSSITLIDKGENFIYWSYDNTTDFISLSLDGNILTNFNSASKVYIASNLLPESEHTLNLRTVNDIINSTVTTLAEPITNEDNFYGLIFPYLLFLLGLICLVAGFYEPIISFGAFIFGVIGILTALNDSFIMGTMFVLLIIASIFVAFREMK